MNEHGTERKLGRREMLAAGAATVAGAVVAATLPDVARAGDGDPLTAGSVTTATGPTGVESEDGVLKGVFLGRPSDDPTASHAGVMGLAMTGGVWRGPHCGVLGGCDNENSEGVLGYNSAGGIGVRGFSGGGYGAGVWGMNAGEGSGVMATGDHLALEVHGRATFSRSGRGKVPTGMSSVLVSVPSGLATSALVLATLQNAGTGVYLKYAKRADATHFKVVLSKVAPSATYFAWFVVG